MILTKMTLNKISKEILEYFKSKGFKGRGKSVRKKEGHNTVVLNIQKSRDSSKFTINIGVYSYTLGMFYDTCDITSPSIEECHWQVRIGNLKTNNEDLWFDTVSLNAGEIVKTISNILENDFFSKMPQIVSDNGLKNRWLINNNSNVTEFDRLLNLTVLLKNGDQELFSEYVSKLKLFAKSKGLSIDYHISKLYEK